MGIGAKTYAYDGLNRLRSFDLDGQPLGSYTYDRYGNLTSFTEGTRQTEISVTATNKPTWVTLGGSSSRISWDHTWGHITQIWRSDNLVEKLFTYSCEDRLMTAEDTASHTLNLYAYDTNGERVATWRRNLADSDALVDATFHIRDEAGHVLSDWMYLPDDYFDLQRDYVVAGGKIIAKMTHANDSITYLVSDHLGSTRVEVDGHGDPVNTGGDSGEETQTDYYPFGRRREDLGEPVDLRHRFTGHERDLGAGSSELDYMHARYYSPLLGRFVSVDRVGGEVGRSQSWNRYSYVGNSPLGFLDPNGDLRIAAHWYGPSLIGPDLYSYGLVFESSRKLAEEKLEVVIAVGLTATSGKPVVTGLWQVAKTSAGMWTDRHWVRTNPGSSDYFVDRALKRRLWSSPRRAAAAFEGELKKPTASESGWIEPARRQQ